MSTRDSRAEARKAWMHVRPYFSRQDRKDFRRAIIDILESLARREYEACYRDARNERERAYIIGNEEA